MMTVFSLKILALICMLIDHIGAYLPDMPVQLRWIGRIAAPLFVFCLCEGVDHTSDERKYLLRLYAGSILMAVIQMTTGVRANIFRTLFAIAFNCVMIKNIRKGRSQYIRYYALYLAWQLITVILFGWLYAVNNQAEIIRRLYPAIAGSIAFCEYGVPFVIFGIMIYLLKDNKKKLIYGYIIYVALFALLSLTKLTKTLTEPLIAASASPETLRYHINIAFFTVANSFRPGVAGGDGLHTQYQWMMIISLIPILMYNGKKGRSMKWFFYAFYVLHLLGLWYLGTILAAA